MALVKIDKKLKTGTEIKVWNYDRPNNSGLSVAVKNGSIGDYDCLVQIESVVCAEGTVDRLVIKKSVAKKLGMVVIEE